MQSARPYLHRLVSLRKGIVVDNMKNNMDILSDPVTIPLGAISNPLCLSHAKFNANVCLHDCYGEMEHERVPKAEFRG